MPSLVWPKLCDQETQGFVPKITWSVLEPHFPEGLMLEGVVMKGLVWEMYEALLWPPVSPLRRSTTWLVTCQGKTGQGRVWTAWLVIWNVRWSKPHGQQYASRGKVTLGLGSYPVTLVVPVLPVARYPRLSVLVTFCTWLIAPILLMSV